MERIVDRILEDIEHEIQMRRSGRGDRVTSTAIIVGLRSALSIVNEESQRA